MKGASPLLPYTDSRAAEQSYMKLTRTIFKGYRIRGFLLVMVLVSSLFLSACQPDEPETVIKPADYGRYGSNLALKLARDYPLRSAGSTQEKRAGDWIIKMFEEEDFEPDVSTFYFQDDEGNTRSSRNISIRIPGHGFTLTDDQGKTQSFRRNVIIGAHYDTFFSEEDLNAYLESLVTVETDSAEPTPTSSPDILEEPTLADYDGIHDNASGIGALLLIARELKQEVFGYDVTLVAFGAGESGQAGARAYAKKMSRSDIEATDAMYCIDSIYAGDKMYAHAGQNSIRSYYRKDYEKRRKLYEVTDVFYEHELYTNNEYMLYTNQSSFDVYFGNLSSSVLYREWTLTESDYLPFDELDIPIVFFESYDYDGSSIESLKESKNPAFASTTGAIRHTVYDTTGFIGQVMNLKRSSIEQDEKSGVDNRVDHLTKRINNTSFIIIEAIKKGVHNAEMQNQTLQTSEQTTTG